MSSLFEGQKHLGAASPGNVGPRKGARLHGERKRDARFHARAASPARREAMRADRNDLNEGKGFGGREEKLEGVDRCVARRRSWP